VEEKALIAVVVAAIAALRRCRLGLPARPTPLPALSPAPVRRHQTLLQRTSQRRPRQLRWVWRGVADEVAAEVAAAVEGAARAEL